jgi:hypothetical protein
MKIVDLFERVKVTDAGDRRIKVSRNGNAQELANIVLRSQVKDARVIVDGRDVYVWDAAEATHFDMKHYLGLGQGFHLYVNTAENAEELAQEHELFAVGAMEVDGRSFVLSMPEHDRHHLDAVKQNRTIVRLFK